MQPRSRIKKNTRGFTLVELLTSVAVFSIGATGVIALQNATIAGNGFAGELTTAYHIAQSWEDVLSMDAEQWGESFANPEGTYWLTTAEDQDDDWIFPDYQSSMRIGSAFDMFGQPLETGTGARYCAQIRVRWLCEPGSADCGGEQNLGNGLLAADVRVFWPRRRPASLVLADFCVAETVADGDPDPANFHSVAVSSAIKQAALR
jgi:prepilin-type N-terminal cleavage/methylation domain-containing protein